VPDMATALVQTGPRALETRQFPLPRLPEGAALLRVEACGMCGSDLEYYAGVEVINASHYPRILGHEVVRGSRISARDRATARICGSEIASPST
jgi:D-arabinose 1-dehydrogenase-like Zn-dependent alcohol dehydrogenase